MKRKFETLTANASTLSQFDYQMMKQLRDVILAIAESNIENPEIQISRHPASLNFEFFVRDTDEPAELYAFQKPANLVAVQECRICFDAVESLQDNGECSECAPVDNYIESVTIAYNHGISH